MPPKPKVPCWYNQSGGYTGYDVENILLDNVLLSEDCDSTLTDSEYCVNDLGKMFNIQQCSDFTRDNALVCYEPWPMPTIDDLI